MVAIHFNEVSDFSGLFELSRSLDVWHQKRSDQNTREVDDFFALRVRGHFDKHLSRSIVHIEA